MTHTDGRPPPWFATAFGEIYPILYGHRDDASAAREAASAARLCELTPASVVLDLGCGGGRHLAPLVAQGLVAFGMDLSRSLLKESRRRGLTLLARGDMRRLPFAERTFAAVLSFFTSFGYFASDQEDRSVVAHVRRVLRPGGRYLLDYLDAERVVRDLVPRSERAVPGYTILEERRIEDRRVKKLVRITPAAGMESDVVEFEESVRLYTAEDLRALLEAEGLRVLCTLGDLDGRPLGEGDRCVLLAERP